jgi:hypothetical protein
MAERFVRGQMEVGDFEPYARFFDDEVEFRGERGHPIPEVLTVLTCDIIGENEIEDYRIEESQKQDKIHIAKTV